MPGPISIYEHQASLLTSTPRRDPRFAELDQLIASGQTRRKKIPGTCRFCGHWLESGKAVRGHERICSARPVPLRPYPKRNTIGWKQRREKYLRKTGGKKKWIASISPSAGCIAEDVEPCSIENLIAELTDRKALEHVPEKLLVKLKTALRDFNATKRAWKA